jgi:site-specific recombinase XerD
MFVEFVEFVYVPHVRTDSTLIASGDRGAGMLVAARLPLILTLGLEGWDPMASLRKRGKVWCVRFRDASGRQIEKKYGPDRSVAQRIANGLESQVHAIKTGVADPREVGWAEAERKPLAVHVRDWHAFLVAKGDVAQHADQSRDRVLRLIESVKLLRISGLTISAAQRALADLRLIKGRRGRQRLSESSMQHHARAIKSFSRWLWRDGRVREDPLIHMVLPEVNDRFTRRALEPSEATALIESTDTRPTRARMTGQDRAITYAVALGTGFRLRELASLTPESFCLDGDPPSITCDGVNTKNGQAAVQPIRAELVAMLRSWLDRKPSGVPVFALNRNDAARTLRADLRAAGIESWADFDFHSLRHSYITQVVKSGASVKVCQQLARHADPRLTMNVYSHLTIHDLCHGLDGLAHVLPTAGVSAGLTGTDPITTIPSPGRPLVDPKHQSGKLIAPKLGRWTSFTMTGQGSGVWSAVDSCPARGPCRSQT